MYLSKKGYVIKKESISNETLVDLKHTLTAKPLIDSKFSFKIESSPNYPIFIETKNKIYIPKMYGITKFGFPKNVLNNYNGISWDSNIPFNGNLYDRQLEPANILINECKEKGGGILALATGFGKSICGLYVLSQLKGKTIIVVNKIPLMNQWVSEIKNFLPNAKVGILQGQKNIDIHNKDIVVAMLQSLARVDYPDCFFDDFRVVLIDECFPYDTHIITSNGNINIGQLYYMKKRGENLPTVKTFNEITKKFEYKKIVNAFRKQNDILIEIHCSKMKIKSTKNHKYLTNNGWKEAKDLNLNDYIISNYDKNTINSVCPALNDDQYQIVLGSFLGDGHIQQLKNGRYRLSMTHGKDQEFYCKWKAEIFNINNVRYIEKNGYSNKEAYTFSTKTFYLFNNLPKTKTSVPQWVLNELDERGLAIWFMDDGSINKKSFSTRISTDSFDEDSQKRIVLKLKSMNIDCKYIKYIKYKKSYYCIIINESGTKNLIRLISKYIHNNILYKLLPCQYINYIQDMSIEILDNTTIFCAKENIKKEFLIENQTYKIYKNNKKDDVKYLNCTKCNTMTLHYKSNIYEYWICNHTSKKILENMPLIFSEYKWNNTFLDYGYSKITSIVKNIPNFNESKFKRNYVFDLEIEDNHNYIVKNVTHGGNNQNGFVVHNCHNTASQMFSKVLFNLCSKYTIGLSATPNRSDGCEYVFKHHIGEIVYKGDTERTGKPPILKLVKIESKEYKEISTENKFTGQKQIQFTSMLSELIDMPKRNSLIIELIKQHILQNRKILVLSDRRNHLLVLKNLLDKEKVTFTYGLFLGAMKQTELDKARSAQVILATFQAFGEGVSEKDLDTLILCSPKKYIGHMKTSIKNEGGKLNQIVGRIFRRQHIERNPVIIDLQDHFSVYKNQAAQRRVFYKEHFKNGIFEEHSINLDEHNKIKIENIQIKKSKVKKNEELENTANLLQYCIIDD
jgi:superfamily II DNA or RNA helicase